MGKIVPKKKNDNLEPQKYYQVLLDVKIQIDQSQAEAFAAVNMILNKRNWLIGKIITEKQAEYSWGSAFIETLSKDIQNLYPGIEGFSRTNIFRMKAFYDAYKNPTAVGLLENMPMISLPWGHNALILAKSKSLEESIWYAQKSLDGGWSRSTLGIEMKKNLYAREGKAITNFNKMVPNSISAIIQQTFKDPYIFDFLTLQKEHLEHDLEEGLMNNVQKMLLEMGKGFALVGRQYHLQVGHRDFYIDLLFFHVKLKCYVVVELKAQDLDPAHAGQLAFYISAVDETLREEWQNPTIGLLLCKSKDNYIAEYTLKGINGPIGISEYATKLTEEMKKEIKSSLPTISELEAELKKVEAINDLMTKSTTKK
ncbi:MAG: PDDEXK nuclease domain-containing protein [Candidatus Chromulinivorax sp.]|nr:PDDEXK nuclease domain-containing protein [Candidatus Chromulinivorax sp.]